MDDVCSGATRLPLKLAGLGYKFIHTSTLPFRSLGPEMSVRS